MRKHTLALLALLALAQTGWSQRGYYDAPYKRYEADEAVLSKGAAATAKSWSQDSVQSEASGQLCVNMDSAEATLEFTFLEAADGFVIRYCVPDSQQAVIALYDGDQIIDSLILTSKWSWEYLWNNGDPNNTGITNKNPKMRFDEVRYHLPAKISQLKIVKVSGNFWIDFIEMEPVPEVLSAPAGASVYSGDGSNLQAFIDAHGGKTIYIPEGVYRLNSQLYFGAANTRLQGAGMWYSQLHFTVTDASNGGLRANAQDISYADLYLTTDMTTRTKGYAGVLGVYTARSVVRNIWVEHCAVGAWIAQYVAGGPAYADGFLLTGCRFRNTYADGINLCKGTRNAIVEHCNFRNNGDDGQAIWCAEGLECINNTFRNNTVENGWRAAGAALYGGKDNKFYNILIRDNVEIGITVSNLFQGVGFNAAGQHLFQDITLIGCGTFNDCYNKRVGAVNIVGASSAGTRVQNVKITNIDILESKCDAIRIYKNSGTGIYGFSFSNIQVDGTGREYPFNNADSSNSGRGYVAIFENSPLGSASYCNLNYTNLGGNAGGVDFNKTQIGSFKWNALNGCDAVAVTGILLSLTDTSLAGGAKLQLSANLLPADASNRIVIYSSGNPLVALVNSAGFVTTHAKGTAIITATTLDGGFTASCNLEVVSDPTICYRIKNRWQNTYLYDAGDRVKYSAAAGNNSYLWVFQDTAGCVRIRNLGTRDYMHTTTQLGYIECSSPAPTGNSALWTTEDAGSGFIRIRNELDTSDYIHIEKLQGQAQYGSIGSDWWSAMWGLEAVSVVTAVQEKMSGSSDRLYPNPTTGDFFLSLAGYPANEMLKIDILSLTGQEVYSTVCQANGQGDNLLELQAGQFLKTGIYLLRVQGKSETSCLKLVVSK